jgi:hypothetical protein
VLPMIKRCMPTFLKWYNTTLTKNLF